MLGLRRFIPIFFTASGFVLLGVGMIFWGHPQCIALVCAGIFCLTLGACMHARVHYIRQRRMFAYGVLGNPHHHHHHTVVVPNQVVYETYQPPVTIYSQQPAFAAPSAPPAYN